MRTSSAGPRASAGPQPSPWPTLSIGEVSARTGLTTYTLRFYEQEGLFIGPVQRDTAGRRVFTEAEVTRDERCVVPNYTVHLHTARSTGTARADLARRIAHAHAAATGAPPSFAQVIISPVDEHFIGGEPVDARSVFVHGHIRAGRSAGTKDELVAAIRDAVRDALAAPEDLVWVYVSELPAAQMVEFGHVLPAPGREPEWQAALPDALRRRLAHLDGDVPGADVS